MKERHACRSCSQLEVVRECPLFHPLHDLSCIENDTHVVLSSSMYHSRTTRVSFYAPQFMSKERYIFRSLNDASFVKNDTRVVFDVGRCTQKRHACRSYSRVAPWARTTRVSFFAHCSQDSDICLLQSSRTHENGAHDRTCFHGFYKSATCCSATKHPQLFSRSRIPRRQSGILVRSLL